VDYDGVRAIVYSPRSGDDTVRRLEKLVRSHVRNAGSRERHVVQAAVRKVKEHIEGCYQREVPLDELAALAAMNKFLLLRAFAREVGYPPHSYQLLVRVFHARRLLSLGQTAAEVATAVGFSDQSHLIRQFKRIEGMTPSEYVRRNR
jgi:AraC-like DNA-binding protein